MKFLVNNTKICSVHDRPFRKPACSSLSWLSTAFSIRIRMILVNTLDVIDNRDTPRQLLQSDRPVSVFWQFCDEFFLPVTWYFSSSQMISNRTDRASVACSVSAFCNSVGCSS